MSVRQGNGSGGTTISGDVTVVQPTGTQLHVVVDTAPTTAVTNAGLTELAAAINASSQMDVNIAASGATVPVSLTSTTITGTIAVTQSGTWDEVGINDSGNSITVDNAALSVVGGGVELTALRVTLASDSTGVLSVDDNGGALTVDGTVTANLAAGTNNIGDVDVLTLPSLVAGTALIGKVSIDQVTANANEVVIKSITAGDTNIGNVDIASIAAGDNNIGNVDIVSGTITTVTTVTTLSNQSQEGGVNISLNAGAVDTGTRRIVQANGAGKTILSAGGSASSSGNNTLVAAGTNKLKVFAFSLTTTSTTAMTCIFQSGAGGTELWRVIIQAPSGANAGANLTVAPPAWLFATASATLLNLNLSSANAVHWSVSYYDEA